MGSGEDVLEAAVSAVEVMEADGRYGAGRGGYLSMDGKTIELDAGVMDTRGRLGAVAGVEEVVHAVRLARRVADTPHVLIVGTGATELARKLGLQQRFEPTEKVRKEFREYVEKLEKAGPPQGPPSLSDVLITSPRRIGARDLPSPSGSGAYSTDR